MLDLTYKKKSKNNHLEKHPEKISLPEPRKSFKEKLKKFKKPILVTAVLVVFGLISGLPTLYFYKKYKKALSDQSQNVPKTEETDQEQLKKITESISRFMDLPENEEPVFASVTDAGKLNSQPFFSRAQNGDKVLIYLNAKKAILYRPETERVIEFSSISGANGKNQDLSGPPAAIQDQGNATSDQTGAGNAQAQGGQAQSIARVSLYNGTGISNGAQAAVDALSKIEGIEVVETINSKANYSGTTVIDLNGKFPVLAAKIALATGGKIGSLPERETKPNADILVIQGQASTSANGAINQ